MHLVFTSPFALLPSSARKMAEVGAVSPDSEIEFKIPALAGEQLLDFEMNSFPTRPFTRAK